MVKKRRLVFGTGLIAVALGIALTVAILRDPRHGGTRDDRARVDLEHVIASAIWANAVYHEPEQIRKDVGAEVLIRDFPLNELRIFITEADETSVQWVAVRGTANLANIYDDLDFVERENHELAIRVHRGFDEALQECLPWVIKNLDPEQPVILTGHSLGGAVAALLLAVLDQRGFKEASAVTFGQPKVTDLHGAETYGHLDLLRIMHEEDPVPLVPPIAPTVDLDPDDYHHFGAEVVVKASGHFYYLADHDFRRIDVMDFWTNLLHIRPLRHDMIKGYLPALKAAQGIAKKHRGEGITLNVSAEPSGPAN